MGVDKPRHQRKSPTVDQLSIGASQFLQVVPGADGQDSLAAHRDGVGHGLPRIQR
jgi:hypothetical protein